jgi:endonuclease YncB( thermonuclease family)
MVLGLFTRRFLSAFILALAVSTANASPVDPGQVEVIDGDSIRVKNESIRLIGFDAPETYRAQCSSERELGNRATFRLRQLVAGGATWSAWLAPAAPGRKAPRRAITGARAAC